MPFCCKFIDRLDFQSIFRDSSVESLLPPTLKDFLPLKVYYKYNNPIGRKLFNYGSFLKDLNTSQIQEILKGDCSCSTSPYLYAPHGHIITGDLNIIPDKRLRDLMAFGAKYREPSYMAPGNIKLRLSEYVDSFITKISKKYKESTNSFLKSGRPKSKVLFLTGLTFLKKIVRMFFMSRSLFLKMMKSRLS